MTERVFVDTNVLLRHLLADHPVVSPAATRFIAEIATGQRTAVISDTVLFETIYVLEKVRGLKRQQIRRELGRIIVIPFVDLPNRALYPEAFDRYVERPALSFADCYHIVLARKLSDGRLATFDQAAGRAEGVDWIQPA